MEGSQPTLHPLSVLSIVDLVRFVVPIISLEQIGSNYPIKTSISALWIFSDPDTSKQSQGRSWCWTEGWLPAFKGSQTESFIQWLVWWTRKWGDKRPANYSPCMRPEIPPRVLMTRSTHLTSLSPQLCSWWLVLACVCATVRVSRQMRHLMRQGTLGDTAGCGGGNVLRSPGQCHLWRSPSGVLSCWPRW